MVKIEGKDEDSKASTASFPLASEKRSQKSKEQNGNSERGEDKGDDGKFSSNGGTPERQSNGAAPVPVSYKFVAKGGGSKRNSLTPVRKFEPKKTSPQGPFPVHKIKYNHKNASEVEWPKNAKFFELVEVYLPALDIPDQAKQEAKKKERQRAARLRKKKRKSKKKKKTDENADETKSQSADMRDATMQTETDLNSSFRSTRDIEITLAASVKSMDTKSTSDGADTIDKSVEGAWAATEKATDDDDDDDDDDESDDDDDESGSSDGGDTEIEVDDKDGDTEKEDEEEERGAERVDVDPDKNEAASKTDVSLQPTETEDDEDVDDIMERYSSQRTEEEMRSSPPASTISFSSRKSNKNSVIISTRKHSTPRRSSPRSPSPSHSKSSRATTPTRSKSPRSTTSRDKSPKSPTSRSKSPRLDLSRNKSPAPLTARFTCPRPVTPVPPLDVNGAEEYSEIELPPTPKTLAKDEQTAIEVRQMYKEEVVQLFNHMEHFRIECNKESANFNQKMDKKKKQIREEMLQLKRDRHSSKQGSRSESSVDRAQRERDMLKASIEVDYIKKDTDLIRKKEELLQKGSWVLEMEEKLKQRKDTLREWEDEMDEIEGYLSRRYEFAKKKEDNLGDVEDELRKLRGMLDDEKEQLDRQDLGDGDKQSKKAQLHWDFVQKATLEKEQLLELAIKRHKKKAADMESQVREKDTHISSLDDKVKKLQEDLAKREQKLKELDSHLSVVLHENNEREPDRTSRRSSMTRGSTANVPGTSGANYSRTTSLDARSKSASLKGSKYGTPGMRSGGGGAVNENPGTVVGYTGAGPSGYSGGSSRGNVVVPGTSQPPYDPPRPRINRSDTKIEFNRGGAKNSRSCSIM